MKILLANLAAIGGAVTCGPLLALVAEAILVPLFYATQYEATAGWAALYIAGPAGIVGGFVTGGWLVLRNRKNAKQHSQPVTKRAFVHE